MVPSGKALRPTAIRIFLQSPTSNSVLLAALLIAHQQFSHSNSVLLAALCNRPPAIRSFCQSSTSDSRIFLQLCLSQFAALLIAYQQFGSSCSTTDQFGSSCSFANRASAIRIFVHLCRPPTSNSALSIALNRLHPTFLEFTRCNGSWSCCNVGPNW